MQDLSRMIRILRKDAALYQIDPDQIIVCGFSAGAHLCGSTCVHHMDVVDCNGKLEYASPDKHVTKDAPPCFIWQMAKDETVPVENSDLFARACQRQKVPYAYHVFSEGSHGLSLADEDWANARYKAKL